MVRFGYGEYSMVKFRLQNRYGSVANAAKEMNISYHNLSRILNGKFHELKTHVKILIAIEELPAKKYKFPREDMETFKILNGIK